MASTSQNKSIFCWILQKARFWSWSHNCRLNFWSTLELQQGLSSHQRGKDTAHHLVWCKRLMTTDPKQSELCAKKKRQIIYYILGRLRSIHWFLPSWVKKQVGSFCHHNLQPDPATKSKKGKERIKLKIQRENREATRGDKWTIMLSCQSIFMRSG
jgi:hypothetical protein